MKQKKTVSILLTAAILAASFSPGGGDFSGGPAIKYSR